METRKTETDHVTETRAKVLEAALPLVVFDGWSEITLQEAITDSGVDAGLARLVFARGGVDLALAFHMDGDRQLAEAMAEADLEAMRYRDRVAFGVRKRLEIAGPDREAVRRGSALFALPIHAADGSKAIWHTADTIWNALGDTSRDVNWYTKRATLSAVYSSAVLYWLGDESDGNKDTWDFIDRRIENVMQFEKVKATLRNNPLAKAFMSGPGRLIDKIKAPGETPARPFGSTRK